MDAGDDYEALMILCKADVTFKNEVKVKRYLENFEKVKMKVIDVEERDHLRNFQPVITGEDIMEMFNLQPSKVVGEIKTLLREAILEGTIKNEPAEAEVYVRRVAAEKFNLQG